MGFLIRKGIWLVLAAVLAGCTNDNAAEKIGFDLEILNEDGLYGTQGNLRPMEYEFCIPVGKNARDEVASIDPSVHCSPGRGLVGCRMDELLCRGNSEQKGHKRILIALARLNYVDRIEQSVFE